MSRYNCAGSNEKKTNKRRLFNMLDKEPGMIERRDTWGVQECV